MLTACSSGDEGSGDDSGTASMDESGADGFAEGAASQRDVPDVDLVIDLETNRDLIKTGRIELESTDIDELLGELDGVVTMRQGIVESEDVRTDDDGDAKTASVVLRVPVDSFEATVDEISQLGTLVRRDTSTEDVTTRVADVDARVASAQRSIDQLQLLFDRATSLRDVITLESELSQRQADLESLQARQRSLARQTALSTIHVSVTKSDPEAKPDDGDEAGFIDGIESGWSGLVTFVRGTTHVVGLTLPLGTLALVLAVPVWLVVRRIHLPSRSRPSD